LDADQGHAAFPPGSILAPEIALLVSWRIGLSKGADHDVVIEAVEAARVLRGIDHADRAFDAEPREILQVGLNEPLEKRRDEQKLDPRLLSRLGVCENAVLDLPARILEEHGSLAQIGADIVGRVVRRILVDFGEHLGRHAVLDLVQDLELASLRQVLWSGELAVLEIAADARILTVEQVLVGPLEIEGEVECLAYPAVLKLGAAQIENEALHRLRALDRDLLAPNEAFTHRAEIVSRRPVLRARLLPVIEIPGLQALKGDSLVAVIVEPNLVVVPLASVHGEVLAPIVGDALIGDRAPGRRLLDAVGTRAERRL